MKYFVIAVLAIFFVYMVVWTLKYHFFNKRQQKVKRIQELREKGKVARSEDTNETKNYWYNKREVEACTAQEDVTRYYNYFEKSEEAVRGLLLEMYDCGVVRIDELEQISYGEDRFENTDLSFLEEEEVIQVEGMMGGFFAKPQADVMTASKELKGDDPGIMDIHGTLSDGVVNVLAAVEAEQAEEAKKNEPILIKEEKSVEEARRTREITGTSEIRNQIYSKWSGYVEELLAMVTIHAEPEMQQRIGKALMDYGYNDVDILLESPEYDN